MASNALFAEVAALLGDPGRASMLHALMDGRSLTASVLAQVAGITPQTASGHLNRMRTVGLLSLEERGRHRHYRLAVPSVARMIESIMQVAAELAPDRKTPTVGLAATALRKARTCYDHLAGQLGVALTDALVERGQIELTNDAGILTEAGISFLGAIGVDTNPILARRTNRSGRVLCRACFDWSERRSHLGGIVAAAICAHSMRNGWTRRQEGTRALLITPSGERVFREIFGVRIG